MELVHRVSAPRSLLCKDQFHQCHVFVPQDMPGAVTRIPDQFRSFETLTFLVGEKSRD